MINDIQYYKEHLEELIFNVPKEERETVINYNYNDNYATIYTSDKTVLTKLKKNMAHNPNEYKLIKLTCNFNGITSVTVTCPKRYVSMRSGIISQKK